MWISFIHEGIPLTLHQPTFCIPNIHISQTTGWAVKALGRKRYSFSLIYFKE